MRIVPSIYIPDVAIGDKETHYWWNERMTIGNGDHSCLKLESALSKRLPALSQCLQTYFSHLESTHASEMEEKSPLPWMRSACRAQSTPAQRTHALPQKFASHLSGFGLLPPRQAWIPFRKTSSVALGVGRAGTPSGQACTAPSGKSLNTGATKCTIAHFSSVASVTTLKPKRTRTSRSTLS